MLFPHLLCRLGIVFGGKGCIKNSAVFGDYFGAGLQLYMPFITTQLNERKLVK